MHRNTLLSHASVLHRGVDSHFVDSRKYGVFVLSAVTTAGDLWLTLGRGFNLLWFGNRTKGLMSFFVVYLSKI